MMEKGISPKELVKIIKDNPDINFIGVAVTPWHAISVDASIAWLKDHGTDVKGICLISPHMDFGYVTDTSAFSNAVSLKYRYKYSNNAYRLLKRKYYFYKFVFGNRYTRKHDNPFYLLSCGMSVDIGSYVYEILPHKHIRFILTEEGIGAFLGTVVPQKLTHNNTLLSYLKYLKQKHYRSMTDYVAKHHDILDQRMFKQKEDGELELNKELVPYYRDSITDKAKKTIKENKIVDLHNSVLLCTTAWIRNDIQDEEDYKVLLKVCDLLHSKGINIILKPHPRDSFFAQRAAQLHAQPLKQSYPIEMLCAISRPKAIIGYSSTALVTAKLFWDIPAFCLSDLMEQSKMNDYYLKETGNFKKRFRNIISFPQSLAEIDI